MVSVEALRAVMDRDDLGTVIPVRAPPLPPSCSSKAPSSSVCLRDIAPPRRDALKDPMLLSTIEERRKDGLDAVREIDSPLPPPPLPPLMSSKPSCSVGLCELMRENGDTAPISMSDDRRMEADAEAMRCESSSSPPSCSVVRRDPPRDICLEATPAPPEGGTGSTEDRLTEVTRDMAPARGGTWVRVKGVRER